MAKKGYWIARVDTSDVDQYKLYVEAATPAYEQYGATFLVRGGTFEAAEGTSRSRNVVIEFPSYQAALDCYNSETYVNARKIRQKISESELIIIEGY